MLLTIRPLVAGMLWRAKASARSKRARRLLASGIAISALYAAGTAAPPTYAGFTLKPKVGPLDPSLRIPDETIIYHERVSLSRCIVTCPGPDQVYLGTSTSQSACEASPSYSNCDGQDPAATGCASNGYTNESDVDYSYATFYVNNRWSTSCRSNWTRAFYTDNYTRTIHSAASYNDNSHGYSDYYTDPGGQGGYMWGRMVWGGAGSKPVYSEADTTCSQYNCCASGSACGYLNPPTYTNAY